MTWWLEPVSLVFVVGSAGGCLGGFFALLCSNMRMSRCKKIQCCCGLFTCDRENLSESEYSSEIENQHSIEQHNRPRSNSNDENQV